MGLFDKAIDRAEQAITWAYRERFRLLSLRQRLRLDGASRAYGAASLIGFLKNRYPRYPLLSCAGHEFPVTIFPSSGGPRRLPLDDPGPVALAEDWQPHLEFLDRKFFWLMRPVTGSQSYRCFVMKCLDPVSPLLTCGVSDYFTALKTAFALEWELLCASASDERRHCGVRVPLRDKIERAVPDPIMDGNGRASAVAISALLAVRHEGMLKLLLRRRGMRSLAVSRGKWHVVPAGMFQAPYGDYRREFSVTHTFLWEYYEELFGAPDPMERRQDAAWFYEDGPVKDLRTLLKDGRAKVYFTGYAVNLVSLRPEVLLAVIIDDETWVNRRDLRHNEEYAQASDLPIDKVPLAMEPVPASPVSLFEKLALTPETITPPGVACLHQGIISLNEADLR